MAGLDFNPGEMWFLGKPFSTIPIDDAGLGKSGYALIFKTVDNADYPVSGIIGAPVPEPATWLLATSASLGLIALRRRAR